jgi:hypothetical protein
MTPKVEALYSTHERCPHGIFVPLTLWTPNRCPLCAPAIHLPTSLPWPKDDDDAV